MKKTGFTLAEVLITLGIIGVIAALTLPSLQADTVAAQIGPKLAKAVSSFEQANMALLDDQNVDDLSDSNVLTNATTYRNALTDFMKASTDTYGNVASGNSDPVLIAKDGVVYLIEPINLAGRAAAQISTTPHRNYIGRVDIDINGTNRPNAVGEDHFVFGLFGDGSLRPKGGSQSWNVTDNNTWTTRCAADATPADATYCAGHIFENNLKVLYK